MNDAAPPPTPSVTVFESDQQPFGQIIQAGHHVAGADEPERLGGHDTGMAPYELLLAPLGACTSMTIRMYADRKQWPLRHVSVALRHIRGTSESGPLDRFDRRITLDGDLTDEQRQHLDTSETRHDFSGNDADWCDCSGLALWAELSRAPPDEFHQFRGALGGFRLTQVLLAFRASTIASC